MGEDSLRPFLEFKDKWVICLALTSNAGHADFQLGEYEGKKLYERVIETVCKWGSEENLMFVVGATRAKMAGEIRKMIPNHFLLVPGVGAQGGSLSEITEAAANKEVGLLVNSSRGILYASGGGLCRGGSHRGQEIGAGDEWAYPRGLRGLISKFTLWKLSGDSRQ